MAVLKNTVNIGDALVTGDLHSNRLSVGINALISGANTVAFGENTQALGTASHASGINTIAIGDAAHAEGAYTRASGSGAHAEGFMSSSGNNRIIDASGMGSHAEGFVYAVGTAKIIASNQGSHAEGYARDGEIQSTGMGSHAEGYNTKATETASHAEGYQTESSGFYDNWNVGASHAEGYNTHAISAASHAEGISTTASGKGSHAEGVNSLTYGKAAHAEGLETYASGTGAHAEGRETQAYDEGAHAEGYRTYASRMSAHAEGSGTTASAADAHAEGNYTHADGNGAHAEGYYTYVSGKAAHAEGSHTTASGHDAHAEGVETIADGWHSHTEGGFTIVESSGTYSHAEGWHTIAYGTASHAGGVDTGVYAIDHTLNIKASSWYESDHMSFTVNIDPTGYVKPRDVLKLGSNFYTVKSIGSGPPSIRFGSVVTDEDFNAAKTAIIGPSGNITAGFTQGIGTVANKNAMAAFGTYNSVNNDAYGDILFAVGYGTLSGSTITRKNALNVNTNGTTYFNQNYVQFNRYEDDNCYIKGTGSDLLIAANNYIDLNSDDGTKIHNGADVYGSLSASGTITANRMNSVTGFFQTSDKREKNIIGDLDLNKTYDLIDKCLTIIYTLKDDKSNKEQIGMIAQEIQEFFPELITENKEGFLSIDYSRLTVIIFKVLKDLINRITNLEKQIK